MKYDRAIATSVPFDRSDSSVAQRVVFVKTLSWSLMLIGSLAMIWTVARWYVEGDRLLGGPCLFISISASLILLGILIRTEWQRFGIWMSTALVGQAATLQMIDAGRRIHFQHYRQISEVFTTDPLPLLLLVLHSVTMAAAAIYQRKAILEDLKKRIGLFRAMLLFGFLLFATAAVTPDLRVYFTSLVIGSVVTFAGLTNVYLLCEFRPA